MQTFLPYSDFERTAACLDNRRLGNQCYREAKTLFTGGWPNHPASRMWQGHSRALARYGLSLALEMHKRRWQCAAKWIRWWQEQVDSSLPSESPWWLGQQAFHDAHKSNLLRKDPVWYGQFGWDVPDNLPYVWPTRKAGNCD